MATLPLTTLRQVKFLVAAACTSQTATVHQLARTQQHLLLLVLLLLLLLLLTCVIDEHCCAAYE